MPAATSTPRTTPKAPDTVTVRFTQNYLSRRYGFFHKDRVYLNVPSTMKLPSTGAAVIDKADITELDNVVSDRDYDGGLYAAGYAARG